MSTETESPAVETPKRNPLIQGIMNRLRIKTINVSCIVDRKRGGSSFTGFSFARSGSRDGWGAGEGTAEQEAEGEGWTLAEARVARAIMAKEAARAAFLDALARGHMSKGQFQAEWKRIEGGHDKIIEKGMRQLEASLTVELAP